ncbi:hypothetical protein [Halorubrum laminariae]|uniref:Uncharacterized protein n=1 Tax=Halorubrum laminariae TaxID=1433523 RepID=A0ABD6C0B9_9EURY|nr:hypothetical protein [Halorubrum laminariae]
MSEKTSRFTSDRRTRRGASWADPEDWGAGVAENVDVVDRGLVPRRSTSSSDGEPSNVVENFEDGSLGAWSETSNVKIVSNRAYDGSNSLHASSGTSTRDYLLGQRSLGAGVSTVQLFWRETGSSYGHGYQFLDADGGRVAGAGTSNPAWIYVDGGSGYELYSGDGYGKWVRLRLDFDYAQEDVTYTFEDLESGAQRTVTADMDATGSVTQIQKVNVGTENTLAEQRLNTSGSYYGALDSWTDYITIN